MNLPWRRNPNAPRSKRGTFVVPRFRCPHCGRQTPTSLRSVDEVAKLIEAGERVPLMTHTCDYGLDDTAIIPLVALIPPARS